MKSDISRRSLLGAVAALALLPDASCAAEPESSAVSVVDYRRSGDSDDSAAFARAIATGRQVHVPAGQGLGPRGVYLIGDVALAAGSVIFGDGVGRTVIRPLPAGPGGGRVAVFYCDSGRPAARIRAIRLRDMTLHGWVREEAFSEHQHLLHINGVEDAVLERIEFIGFQGDGLYLGAGRTHPADRHNSGVIVRDCTFDGVNNDNRNAISVIDGERILIERCQFRNCGRPNMPGAIDFEPDANPSAVIRNVTIRGCRFQNVGGNVATIAMHINQGVRAVPTGISILNNQFEGNSRAGAEIYIGVSRRLPDSAPDMAILISGNRGSNGTRPYALHSLKGLTASRNIWTDYHSTSILGYIEPHELIRNARISDRFVRCGSRSRIGLAIFNASRVALDGSEFIDCGDGSPNAYAIDFNHGESEYISLQNVRVSSPTGRTRHAVVREAAHRTAPHTNVQRGNDFGGLPAVAMTR